MSEFWSACQNYFCMCALQILCYIKQLYIHIYILFNRGPPVVIVHQTLPLPEPLGAAVTWVTWICFPEGKPPRAAVEQAQALTITLTLGGNFDQNKWRAILLTSQRYRSQPNILCYVVSYVLYNDSKFSHL